VASNPSGLLAFCILIWSPFQEVTVFIEVNTINSMTFERLPAVQHAGWVCQINYTVTTSDGEVGTWVRREGCGLFSPLAFIGAFVAAYTGMRRRAAILRECCYFDGVRE
jgi:hypothetical protein